MYSIDKTFTFSASHQLAGLPEDHPCSRLHGHNYRVKIILYAQDLDDVGFVLDYRQLDRFKEFIDLQCDHYHLNAVLGTINPTAENLAKFFYERALELFLSQGWRQDVQMRIEVSETDKTWAGYEPDVLIGAGGD